MISKPAVLGTGLAPEARQERTPQRTSALDANAPQAPASSPPETVPTPNRTAWWGWLAVIGLAAAAWSFRLTWLPWIEPLVQGTTPAQPKPPVARVIPVTTAIVGQRDMALYLNGLGTATAFKTVTVRSRVEGELLEVHFSEGQTVNAGDVLAEIDSRAFEVQRDQAEGQLARDEATLKLAKLTLERYQDLLKSNVIAQQQLDDQASLVQQTEGAIQAVRAMLANARLQLSYCHIVAPIGGRIGLRLVDQGNFVRANEPSGLAVINQLQPIAVVFTIPQDDIARVLKQTRDDQALTVDVFDRDFRTKLASGKLAAIDNQVDPTTGTLRLKAVFENEDQLLFPNQFVNARLLVDTKRDAIVVPSAAVQRGPTSTFVYVVLADETVDLRNVVIGPIEGSETSIESGLTVGEIVVTDGIDKLQPPKNGLPGTTVSRRDKEAGVSRKDKEQKPLAGAAGSSREGVSPSETGSPRATEKDAR